MLKIKDSVDLKELEKFGFEFYKSSWYKVISRGCYLLLISEKTRQIIVDKIHSRENRIPDVYKCSKTELLEDAFYDLIKSDLVEKAEICVENRFDVLRFEQGEWKMLKIKDNVDLKELEKYGFKNIYDTPLRNKNYAYTPEFDINLNELRITAYVNNEIFVDGDTKKIYIVDYAHNVEYIADEILDKLFELMQAGLVEKVSE